MLRRSRIACSVLAATAYLAVALWSFRAVLPAPATLLPDNPYLDPAFTKLGRLDLAMVLWTVSGNAERLLDRPWALRAEGQCHPLPDAYTLGEHMLGASLLTAPALLATGDPILSYNLFLIATVWIPGLAMYALALHFTRSPPAAFVAGLLFALEPGRIKDAGHPFVHGDLWGPLALLFLHRTFARGGAGNALACALFVGLTVLESLYALLGVLLVLATYGLWAAFVHRAAWRRWAVPLLSASVLVLAVAALVLHPYLAARDTWEVLVRPGTMFLPLDAYAPGRFAFPGWMLLALVAVALVDRLRRRRLEEGEDPRIVLALAALLVVWCSVRTVPLAGAEVPAPLLVLKQLVPGLDAVRALASVGRCAALAAALVAAYGVLAIAERTRAGGPAAVVIAVLLAIGVLIERWVPAASTATFGSGLDLTAFPARPDDDDIALVRAHARGAVLDLPFAGGPQRALAAGPYLTLGSFAPRPTAACYNSYPSPLHQQVAGLVDALPAAEAIDALVALGFETLLVHLDRMRPDRAAALESALASHPQLAARVALLGRTERISAWRLGSPIATGDDLAQLAADARTSEAVTVATGAPELRVALQNRSERTWRQAQPIAPTPVELRWHAPAGAVVHVERARMLLPLAVAPGASGHATVGAPQVPPPGTYVLTIAPVAPPATTLVRATVTVTPAAP